MPALDMPLNELRVYRGLNPRPSDFDLYWDEALEELQTIDPEPTLERATFRVAGAECFHLRFTGIGGARIHAKFLRPANPEQPTPAVLHFHGYSGHSGDWADKLGLVLAGCSVLAMDCRGQGGASEDTGIYPGRTQGGLITRGLAGEPRDLYFRQVFLDTAQLARVARSLPGINGAAMAAMGGSQGGALAVVCAALDPGMIALASAYPFLCDYRRVWEMDLAKDAYEDLVSWFRLFDPRHEREGEVFKRLGYIDIQHLAPRVRANSLMALTLADRICPPSTQFACFNALGGAKRSVVYPDHAHEYLPGWADEAIAHLIGTLGAPGA